jgi:hypothetical protein
MNIKVTLDKMSLEADGKFYPVSNYIRTIKDGTRKASEVVRSIPDNRPYDPQHFPKGTWKITGLDWERDKHFDYRTYGPVKIKTDAWQWVEVWETDDEGDYIRKTAQLVKDTCYWLHYSQFSTTLGCLKFNSPDDAIDLANKIQAAWNKGEEVTLEVV